VNIRKTVHQYQSGLSFIEIMVVLMIIGLFLGIAVPKFMGAGEKAKITTTKSSLRAIQTALDNFKLDHGRYPAKIEYLVKKPTDDEKIAKKWLSPYLTKEETPTDAWDNEFVYKIPGENGKPYDLYSRGDVDAETEQKISVWDN